MFLLNLKRIVHSSLLSFWRNSFVSIASILVVTVTLFVVGAVMFMSVVLNSSLEDLKAKVDVNVYFTINAEESAIMKVKQSLESMPEVASVAYVSREQALTEFRNRHANDELTLQALDELSYNPLGGRLNVVAKDPSQYESVVKFLDERSALATGGLPGQGTSVIEKVNYRQNKELIDRLTRLIVGAERLGFAAATALILISLMITVNTIRLVIYMSREEISVMRLVGASNFYIRGPFVVSGILYGLIAAIFAMLLFYPITLWLGQASASFFGGVNLFEYYVKNFFSIFFILAGIGILLGAVSSYLAARKYLKV